MNCTPEETSCHYDFTEIPLANSDVKKIARMKKNSVDKSKRRLEDYIKK